MTGFVSNFPVLGTQPMDDFFDPDTVKRQPLGFSVSAVDPYWGGAELVYQQAGVAIALGNVCTLLADGTAILMVNTANLGYRLVVALADMASGDYGWFLMRGRYPVKSGASVAANTAIGITAAGVLGANSAGKQVLGAKVVAPATTTVIKTCSGILGQKTLTIVNGDISGWFVGLALSGTGIAASTKVVSISPDGRTIVVNNAFTAQINGGSITGTYNDATIFYNVLDFAHMISQGAIT